MNEKVAVGQIWEVNGANPLHRAAWRIVDFKPIGESVTVMGIGACPLTRSQYGKRPQQLGFFVNHYHFNISAGWTRVLPTLQVYEDE